MGRDGVARADAAVHPHIGDGEFSVFGEDEGVERADGRQKAFVGILGIDARFNGMALK